MTEKPHFSLCDLKPGEEAVVTQITLPNERQLHFLELGLLPGETVRMVRRSPWGDPMVVEVLGIQIGLRASDALEIQVERSRPSS